MGKVETGLAFVEGPRRYWEDLSGTCDTCDFHEMWGFFYSLPSNEAERFFEMRDYLLSLHTEMHPDCQGDLTFFGPPEEID